MLSAFLHHIPRTASLSHGRPGPGHRGLSPRTSSSALTISPPLLLVPGLFSTVRTIRSEGSHSTQNESPQPQTRPSPRLLSPLLTSYLSPTTIPATQPLSAPSTRRKCSHLRASGLRIVCSHCQEHAFLTSMLLDLCLNLPWRTTSAPYKVATPHSPLAQHCFAFLPRLPAPDLLFPCLRPPP